MGKAADVVRAACQVIWTEGDVSRVGEFYAEDFEADYAVTDWGKGLAGVAALARQVRIDLPEYAEHIEELIEAEQEVVVRLKITGRNPQNQQPVSFRDVSILTVVDGIITRQRGVTDYLTLYQQLGVIPAPS